MLTEEQIETLRQHELDDIVAEFSDGENLTPEQIERRKLRQQYLRETEPERKLAEKRELEMIHARKEKEKTAGIERRPCWRCDGTGERTLNGDGFSHTERCHRCGGTGYLTAEEAKVWFIHLGGKPEDWKGGPEGWGQT